MNKIKRTLSNRTCLKDNDECGFRCPFSRLGGKKSCWRCSLFGDVDLVFDRERSKYLRCEACMKNEKPPIKMRYKATYSTTDYNTRNIVASTKEEAMEKFEKYKREEDSFVCMDDGELIEYEER